MGELTQSILGLLVWFSVTVLAYYYVMNPLDTYCWIKIIVSIVLGYLGLWVCQKINMRRYYG